MNLERRVTELEQTRGGDVITLKMLDGGTRRINSKRLLSMVCEVGRGEIKADTQLVLDSVSDDCSETGNGYMTQVIRIAAGGAAQVEAELDSAEGNGGRIQ